MTSKDFGMPAGRAAATGDTIQSCEWDQPGALAVCHLFPDAGTT